MRLVGYGHSAIRATHTKTLEFAHDAQISERATCVVAVGSSGASAAAAGDILLTLRAGGHEFTFHARGNSSWEASGTAVIRRSATQLPGTFATHSSAAARDLPRSLVAAMQDPAAEVELLVEGAATQRPCAVLFGLDPKRRTDPRLAAEAAAADVVIAEDDDAAGVVKVEVTRGSVEVAGRVLVVAARELPGRTVTGSLGNVDVETVGLPPPLAAAAASPSRGPVVLASPADDPREVLRDAPTTARVVLAVPADRVGAVLELASSLRGSSSAVLAEPFAPPLRIDAATARQTGKDVVHLCFDAAPAESAALDPRLQAAIADLLSDGVPTKTAAKALASLAGWERRRAYDAVLNWPRAT